ncbi:MAG: C4-dicarboxylate ABC transporter substrate-binding protein, partial [Gammaproteobacteria bacterium]|nr:C4-dicarboxylate ABC transporter substrate-binding protein [Gammaproteobacteria bacterium]
IDEALDYYVDNYDNNMTGRYQAAIKEQKLVRVTFTPEQTAELNELAESVRQEWVAKHSRNFNARALFDYTAALFAK